MKDYLNTEQFNALMLITRKYERNELYDSYELTPAINYLLEKKLIETAKSVRNHNGREFTTNVFKPTPNGWKIITKKDMPVELANKPLPETKPQKDWRDREADLWANDL